MKHIFSLFLLCTFGIAASFQTLQAQKAALRAAQEHYTHFNYAKAIELYNDYLKKKKKDGEATAQLADCYQKISNYKQAELWYRKALRLDKNNAALQLNYAQVLMNNRKYSDALDILKKYTEKSPRDTRAIKLMDWCYHVEEYLRDSSQYSLRNLPFNVKESDFAAVYYNNGIVFTSARPNQNIERKSGWTGESYVDMYYTEPSGAYTWSEPMQVKDWNESHYHEGPATFTADGNTMYFTRNDGKKNKNGLAVLKIYQSKKRSGKWSEPEELPFNSEDGSFSAGHAAISPDGHYLFFTSDKVGGYGGKDLYMAEYRYKKWGEPKNLGAVVNSAGDEMFPFIHEDGTLYFASNGLGGFGGLDVYYTLRLNNEWEPPRNMGYPVNDATDDFTLVLNTDKDNGFISSNRNGNDDIFQVIIKGEKAQELRRQGSDLMVEAEQQEYSEIPEPEEMASATAYATPAPAKKRQESKIYIIGSLIDSETASPIDKGTVELTDNASKVKKTFVTQADGMFSFDVDPDRDYTIAQIAGAGFRIDGVQMVSTRGKKAPHLIQITLYGSRQVVQRSGDYLPTIPVATKSENPPKNNTNNNSSSTYSGIASSSGGNKNQHKNNNISAEKPDSSKKIPKSDPVTLYGSVDTTVPPLPLPNNNNFTLEPMAVSNNITAEYKVQIGAFKKQLSAKDIYLRPLQNDVHIEQIESVYKYMSGNFNDYETAKQHRNKLRQLGYQNAFVVKYINGMRVSMR
ncbi:MAG: PD40 domain-containing protein [Sphingobacteriales bacterium]|nr:PD40 domain-containing protein [Sphingobacteriales bacterium]